MTPSATPPPSAPAAETVTPDLPQAPPLANARLHEPTDAELVCQGACVHAMREVMVFDIPGVHAVRVQLLKRDGGVIADWTRIRGT